ncbi:MAG: hypothetical protein RL173_1461 [Fibrobacterota bacterium]|jgi:hypothetical protein
MTFPRLAIATLAAMLFMLTATPATAATAGPQAQQAGKSKKAPPTGIKKSKTPSTTTDPVIKVDSLRSGPAMARLIDSLRNASADSVRRLLETARRANSDTAGLRRLQKALDSLQRSANTNQGALDSARRVSDSVQRHSDSLRHATDSVRRIDSATAARRTWYVSIPMGLNIPGPYAAFLRERFVVELRRTGRVRALTGIDTGSWSEGIWPAARASGAGKILATTLGTDSTGGIACMVRVYDLAQGTQLDSSRSDAPDTGTASARALARNLVSLLLPSPRDSACRADSLRMVSAIWAISVRPFEMRDTLSARAVRDSLVASLRRSPWVSPGSLATPDGCASSVCEDSLAKASGATFLLRAALSRQIDSAWTLRARRIRLADGAVVDSHLVTGTSPFMLVRRLAGQLVSPAASCRTRCTPVSGRPVWSVRLASDSASSRNLPRLRELLNAAFRERDDRQFLFPPADLPPAIADSLARASGATIVSASTLSGSDAAWTLTTTLRERPSSRVDTIVLRRGGPASRILPWFARRLSAHGASVEICRNPCRSDSVRRINTLWAVVNDTDSASIKVRTALAGAFPARGKLDTLSNPDHCATLLCLDSLAASRSITKTVWPTFARGKDSMWTLSARIADMESDTWTDSVTLRDSGASAPVLARLANRFWGRANPRTICDSCVSTDTLEAALAILRPAFSGAPDSLRAMVRDSMGRILRREGAYQILDTAGLPGDISDPAAMARLRCRTGAAYVLRTDFALEQSGWRLKASLVDARNGEVVASLDYLDKSRRADRPLELAPWAARRLLGTETHATAPSRHWNLPWTKIARLGIPAVVGITSVLLHL